ncbi:hypothetical protein [Thomasclavelia spiroformis]|uniref:hypothetical protein n=1 Tax=Thomasclavelia spiroformis TaxID=29348 RepID=UPI00241FFACC|nr:hypothetical protein [Thomasclavelia spiroformis]
MSKHDLLKYGENGAIEGLENEREEILEISKLMYEKIKHFGKKDREAILDIMKALSNVSGA